MMGLLPPSTAVSRCFVEVLGSSGRTQYVGGVRAGCPIIMGPFIENIEDIAREFEENGGMSIVKDAFALKKRNKKTNVRQ